jgi:hypothetical protein
LGVPINNGGGPGNRIESGVPPIPPVHLAIRFLLELAMLAGLGLAGWSLWRYAGATLAVAGGAALWGIFGTSGDGSRDAPVIETPGRVHLMLEIVLFALAGYGFWVTWTRAASGTILTLAVLHYAVTWERQWWLFRGATRTDEREFR